MKGRINYEYSRSKRPLQNVYRKQAAEQRIEKRKFHDWRGRNGRRYGAVRFRKIHAAVRSFGHG